MQDEVSFLVPPSQIAEHVDTAVQFDQAGHGEVLQFTTLKRIVAPLLPVRV